MTEKYCGMLRKHQLETIEVPTFWNFATQADRN